MTETLSRLAGAETPSRPAGTTLTRPLPPTSDLPAERWVDVRVTGGLDGVLRVVTLLRGRRYHVTDLQVAVHEGVESRVRCTVLLTAAGLDLLVARLHRLPPVTAVVPVRDPDPA